MQSRLALDAKVKEALSLSYTKTKEVLELSHSLGHRDGLWNAFISVHEMLASMGYDMGGEIGDKLRELSQEMDAPINEDGETVEE